MGYTMSRIEEEARANLLKFGAECSKNPRMCVMVSIGSPMADASWWFGLKLPQIRAKFPRYALTLTTARLPFVQISIIA
jgi:hypothetical protein